VRAKSGLSGKEIEITLRLTFFEGRRKVYHIIREVPSSILETS